MLIGAVTQETTSLQETLYFMQDGVEIPVVVTILSQLRKQCGH